MAVSEKNKEQRVIARAASCACLLDGARDLLLRAEQMGDPELARQMRQVAGHLRLLSGECKGVAEMLID